LFVCLGDILKWRLAWDGLIEVGWMQHHPEKGYSISTFTMILDQFKEEQEGGNNGENDSENNDLDDIQQGIDDQWKLYIRYWAAQCVRIQNGYGLDLRYFVRYRPHFITMFSTFFENDAYYVEAGAQPAEGMERYDKTELAKLLAGSLSYITQYCLHPQLSGEIIREVYQHLLAHDRTCKCFILIATVSEFVICVCVKWLSQVMSLYSQLRTTSSKAFEITMVRNRASRSGVDWRRP
jgi:hypothetical protein